jgi:hypothetical protein
MQPMPPHCAIAIANLLSVTVSIAEEMIGISREIVLVMRVFVLASAGKTFENAGFNNTSSKVKEGAMVSMILRFFVISDKMNLSGKKELANYFWLQKIKNN